MTSSPTADLGPTSGYDFWMHGRYDGFTYYYPNSTNPDVWLDEAAIMEKNNKPFLAERCLNYAIQLDAG